MQILLLDQAIKSILPPRPQLRTAQMMDKRNDRVWMSASICKDQRWVIEFVLNQNIKAMTRDGGYVEGKVVQATEESLLLDVSKSEPKGRFRGESSIQTADIAVVYIKKSGGVAAPAGLGVVGGFLALLGTTYAAVHTNSGPAGALLVIGGTAAGAALGAYAGSELVKKTITINVVR